MTTNHLATGFAATGGVSTDLNAARHNCRDTSGAGLSEALTSRIMSPVLGRLDQNAVLTPTSPPRPTILLVDTLDAYRVMMKWFLTYFDYTVVTARCAEEAAYLFDPQVHTLVLTDNYPLNLFGPDLAQFIKERSPSTLVLMHAQEPPAGRTFFDIFVQKPTHLLAIEEALEKVFKGRSRLQKFS